MASSALAVAGVAAVLLVVVVGVDVSLTTTYRLDVWSGTGWREMARAPMDHESQRYPQPFGGGTVTANATDEIRFRLRVDNGYPWAASHDYRLRHFGEELASGTIDVAARSSAETELSVPAQRFLDGPSAPREPAGVNESPVYVEINVDIDGEYLYGSFQLREAR